MQELVLKLASTLGHRSAGEIVVLLCFLLFVATKGLYSLSADRGKARQEFLQLWNMERARRDPLWCEVLIRHYCREFLPARAIINVASDVQAAEILWLLSDSAKFYKLDDGLVRWRNRRYGNAVGSAIAAVAAFGLYVIFAPASMLLILLGIRNYDSLSIYALGAAAIAGLTFGVVAIKALNHGFDLASARKNFFKIQEIRPSLVPVPVEKMGAVVCRFSVGVMAKFRSIRRSPEDT